MSTIANLSAAIESAAIKSTAIESAAIESAAIESAAIESAAIESAAIESVVIESATIESAATLARANMASRVTLESLILDCPELRKLTVGQLQQYTPKEVATRFLLRAFVSRALSGSAVDWQDKSVKGAMLTTAQVSRAKALETRANEWKIHNRETIIDNVNELLISVHSAIAPATAKAAAVTSELEKARKYLKGLSPETLAQLRKEGVI